MMAVMSLSVNHVLFILWCNINDKINGSKKNADNLCRDVYYLKCF